MQYDWCPFIRKGGRERQGKDGHVAIEDEIRMMHLQVMECKGFLFLLFYFLIGGYFFFYNVVLVSAVQLCESAIICIYR